MKTRITIQLRVFPVTIRDERTGEVSSDVIVLDKPRLQAAQLVGQDSNELIYRMYNRQGYRVLNIGKPEKLEIHPDLELCYQLAKEWTETTQYE